MKSFYDENERYTPEAQALEAAVKNALQGLMLAWADEYPIRQIEQVVSDTAELIALEVILTRRAKFTVKP